MDLQTTTYIFVGASFALYIGVAIWGPCWQHQRVFRGGGTRASPGQWHGDGGGLDVRRLLHFDGWPDFQHGRRRRLVPHGLDRRLRAAAHALGALPSEVRQVHRAPVHRRPFLLQVGLDGGGDLPAGGVPDLHHRPDDGCGRGVLPVPGGIQLHRDLHTRCSAG